MALNEEERRQLREHFGHFKDDGTSTSTVYSHIAPALARHDEVLTLFSDVEPEKRRPVLLFAAVHYLVLKGEPHPLAEIYAAPEARGAMDRVVPQFIDFCVEYSDEITKVMKDRFVQTNEVNRCVGLLPALMIAHRQEHKPLGLVELGSSAGLNLLFDRYRYDYVGGPVIGPPGATVRLSTQLRGRMPKLDAAAPPVDYRIGVDLNPIDVTDEDEELWLRACIWVGEVAREQRLEAAWTLAQREWQTVIEGDAIEKLPRLVEDVPDNLDLCIFHSWMMSWMDRDARLKLVETIHEIAQVRPLWWITYEGAHRVPELQAPEDMPLDASVLAIQRLDGDSVDARILAKIHHHGTWLDWLDGESTAW